MGIETPILHFFFAGGKKKWRALRQAPKDLAAALFSMVLAKAARMRLLRARAPARVVEPAEPPRRDATVAQRERAREERGRARDRVGCVP